MTELEILIEEQKKDQQYNFRTYSKEYYENNRSISSNNTFVESSQIATNYTNIYTIFKTCLSDLHYHTSGSITYTKGKKHKINHLTTMLYSTLTDQQKNVLVMLIVDNYKRVDIAKRLNMSPAGVNHHIELIQKKGAMLVEVMPEMKKLFIIG